MEEVNEHVTVPIPDGSVGIYVKGVYDGVIIWMLVDGTYINRFEGVPGYEHVAAEAAKYIDRMETKNS